MDMALPILLLALVSTGLITCVVFIILICKFSRFFLEFEKFRGKSDVELNSIVWHAKRLDGSIAEIIVELQRSNKLLYELRMGKVETQENVETEFNTEDILRHKKMDVNKTPSAIQTHSDIDASNTISTVSNEYVSVGMHQSNSETGKTNTGTVAAETSKKHSNQALSNTHSGMPQDNLSSNLQIPKNIVAGQQHSTGRNHEPASGSLRHPIQEHAKTMSSKTSAAPTIQNVTTHPPLPPGVIDHGKTPVQSIHATHPPLPPGVIEHGKTPVQSIHATHPPLPPGVIEHGKTPVQSIHATHPPLSPGVIKHENVVNPSVHLTHPASSREIDRDHIAINSVTAHSNVNLKSVPVVKHEQPNISLNYTPVNPEDILGKTKHIKDDDDD